MAGALDLDLQDLDDKELRMSPCPECKSDEVYRYEDWVDGTTIGGELLPKLSSGMFSSAKMRPIVCGDCGHVRYFIDDNALQRLRASKHWNRV